MNANATITTMRQLCTEQRFLRHLARQLGTTATLESAVQLKALLNAAGYTERSDQHVPTKPIVQFKRQENTDLYLTFGSYQKLVKSKVA